MITGSWTCSPVVRTASPTSALRIRPLTAGADQAEPFATNRQSPSPIRRLTSAQTSSGCRPREPTGGLAGDIVVPADEQHHARQRRGPVEQRDDLGLAGGIHLREALNVVPRSMPKTVPVRAEPVRAER